LLGALALMAIAAGLRVAPLWRSTSVPLSPLQAAASAASINTTLMRDADGCAGVRSTVWHPLSGVEYTGRLRITIPAQKSGAMMLYVGDSLPLDIEATAPTGEPTIVIQERLVSGPGVHLPPDFWLDDGSPVDAPGQITRVQIDAAPTHDRVVILSLGRRAPRVVARLIDFPADARAPICADAVRSDEQSFATGWYGSERDAQAASVRWMKQQGVVLLASATGSAVRIQARIEAPAEVGETELTLRVNDVVDLPPVRIRPGLEDYEWSVPDAAWVVGTNELLFSVTRTANRGSRVLGLGLASLHVD
jgi:hypothetical protein